MPRTPHQIFDELLEEYKEAQAYHIWETAGDIDQEMSDLKEYVCTLREEFLRALAESATGGQ